MPEKCSFDGQFEYVPKPLFLCCRNPPLHAHKAIFITNDLTEIREVSLPPKRAATNGSRSAKNEEVYLPNEAPVVPSDLSEQTGYSHANGNNFGILQAVRTSTKAHARLTLQVSETRGGC